MIDWEVGSLDCWVSFDGSKPFPITLYRKQGTWCHAAYPPEPLTDSQKTALEAFVKERMSDMKHLWKPNLAPRLPFDVQTIGKRKKR